VIREETFGPILIVERFTTEDEWRLAMSTLASEPSGISGRGMR